MSEKKIDCSICGKSLSFSEDIFKKFGEPACLTKKDCNDPDEWDAGIILDDEEQEGGNH